MDQDLDWKRVDGGNIDEQIICYPHTARVHYKNRDIRFITVQSDEQCDSVSVEIEYNNGNVDQWVSSQIDVVFCMMWGIPLSFDCKYIFVPQDKGGVCCLSAKDGALVWKTKSRELFKQILVNGNNTLCCASGNHRIVVLDSMTGNELSALRISNINQFSVLGKDRILVDATAKSWYVVHSETLEIMETIDKKMLNTLNGREIWKRIYCEWNSVFEDNE